MKGKILPRTLLGIGLLSLLVGCNGESMDGRIVAAWPESKLAAVPDTLALGDHLLTVSASLGRDYFPPAPVNGRPLAAYIELASGSDAPPSLQPVSGIIRVVYGDRMWVVAARIEPPSDYETRKRFRFLASNGPLWGPGDEATVVLEFADEFQERRLLLARRVMISRSE
ncbi:MAG: hypothetical protein IH621_07155 [Krumholzibacteria bacterium]|nr:hypothetical protein [Candidatus Krumholzibacteria bacterium]